MLRIVLAQQVLAIVVAVGRAHHRVDVVAGGSIVVEDDARLVVELDEDHRAEDAIVEGAGVIERADPSEMRLAQVALRLLRSEISQWPRRKRPVYVPSSASRRSRPSGDRSS